MFLQAIRDMEHKAQEIRAAADYSNNYWKVYGNQYHKYIAFQVSKNLHSYEDHINFIENWLLARWNSFYEIFSTGNLPE